MFYPFYGSKAKWHSRSAARTQSGLILFFTAILQQRHSSHSGSIYRSLNPLARFVDHHQSWRKQAHRATVPVELANNWTNLLVVHKEPSQECALLLAGRPTVLTCRRRENCAREEYYTRKRKFFANSPPELSFRSPTCCRCPVSIVNFVSAQRRHQRQVLSLCCQRRRLALTINQASHFCYLFCLCSLSHWLLLLLLLCCLCQPRSQSSKQCLLGGRREPFQARLVCPAISRLERNQLASLRVQLGSGRAGELVFALPLGQTSASSRQMRAHLDSDLSISRSHSRARTCE